MTFPTAHAAVSIQYPSPICTPAYHGQRIPTNGYKPYVVLLSDFRPETMIMSPSFSLSGSLFLSQDALDWEFSAGTPPSREFGTLEVILEYAGRGFPANPEGIWD